MSQQKDTKTAPAKTAAAAVVPAKAKKPAVIADTKTAPAKITAVSPAKTKIVAVADTKTAPAKRAAAVLAKAKITAIIDAKAAVRATPEIDVTEFVAGVTSMEAAKDVAHECKDYVRLAPTENASFVYMARILYEDEAYLKVGLANCRGDKYVKPRPFTKRLSELDKGYGCNAQYFRFRIIVVMVWKTYAIAPQLEAYVQEALKKWRCDVDTGRGGKFKELYTVCPEVYDEFKKIYETLGKEFGQKLWKSDQYVIGGDEDCFSEEWIDEDGTKTRLSE